MTEEKSNKENVNKIEKVKSDSKAEEKKVEDVHEKKVEKQNESEKKEPIKPEKPKEEKTPETKPVKEKPKKTEAVVRAYDFPISTKHSIAVCKFIKNKKIERAIDDLESVLNLKKSIPMKGEIPHRKGKKMMSGRFPEKTAGRFIKLLKSLSANANSNGLEDPVIVEAIANIGQRPYSKFGSVRKKRTHIKITAKSRGKK